MYICVFVCCVVLAPALLMYITIIYVIRKSSLNGRNHNNVKNTRKREINILRILYYILMFIH